MIVEIWDRILQSLDNGDNAACLLGLDFEKAFFWIMATASNS